MTLIFKASYLFYRENILHFTEYYYLWKNISDRAQVLAKMEAELHTLLDNVALMQRVESKMQRQQSSYLVTGQRHSKLLPGIEVISCEDD